MIRISSFSYHDGGAYEGESYVFDCRKLANPHFVGELKPLNGTHARVQAFVKGDYKFQDVYAQARFHAITFPEARIQFGCYGGRHRSVAAAELLAQDLREHGHEVEVTHTALNLR